MSASWKITIRPDVPGDREELYRARHRVYALELGQHSPTPESRLSDALDAINLYVVAELGGRLAGFISITPPGRGPYSIEKYLSRAEIPCPLDDRTWEVRLLTVLPEHRASPVAALLMYAALRIVEGRGGSRIIAMGRKELVPMYRKTGLEPLGLDVRAGSVTYEVMAAGVADLSRRARERLPSLLRLESLVDWRLEEPMLPEACVHGGAAFERIGARFEHLEKRGEVIDADVLDAWFPPAPGVLSVLAANLEWSLRTSPPTHGEGLRDEIAAARGVPVECIVAAAGSSDLIFTAFPRWLSSGSRVLMPWPGYGEYPHVIENLVGCPLRRFPLARSAGYAVDLESLSREIARGQDLVILVNPNSPTGRHVPRAELALLIEKSPPATRFWIDETYVDYAGEGESLEGFAASSANTVVVKSMSKVYALSGIRAGYLCGPPAIARDLARRLRPWAVGLPGQIAAIEALRDPGYYRRRHDETRALRERLATSMSALGFEVVPGTANFVFADMPAGSPDAAELARRCRDDGLYIREWEGSVRIAVKDAATNERIAAILEKALK